MGVGYIPQEFTNRKEYGNFGFREVNRASSQSQFGGLPAQFPSVR